MAIRDLSWHDHFTHASGLVNLVRVAAASADPETRVQLIAVARAVDEHIEAGVDKVVMAELDQRSTLAAFHRSS